MLKMSSYTRNFLREKAATIHFSWDTELAGTEFYATGLNYNRDKLVHYLGGEIHGQIKLN